MPCPSGEYRYPFADGTLGCACAPADPGVGETLDTCAGNTDGTTVCDQVQLSCRLPRDEDPCAALDGGRVCEAGYTCAGAALTDGGESFSCLLPCVSSASCLDPSTACTPKSIVSPLPDGGKHFSPACKANRCGPMTDSGFQVAAYYGPCTSLIAGDGVCQPRDLAGSGIEGVCVRGGSIAPGKPCAPATGLDGGCEEGTECAFSGISLNRSICTPVCDASLDAGPGCFDAGVCAVQAGRAPAEPNPGLCQPVEPSSPDAGPERFDGGFPAPHLVYPTLARLDGGAILASPHVVTITWANSISADAGGRAAIEAFDTFLVASTWLTAVGADFGVGKGTNTNVALTVAAPGPTVTDQQIQQDLQKLIAAKTVPAPDGATAYVLFFPSSTSVVAAPDDVSCASFNGYHYETSFSFQGKTVDAPYAVIADCGPLAPRNALQQIEATVSHELIEVATDPFVQSNPAWMISAAASPWSREGGAVAEAADLCDGNYLWENGGEYALQRVWSPTAARAGNKSPCLPGDPTDVFFAASVTPDAVVQATAGETVRLVITAWSNAAAAPFEVWAYTDVGSDYQPWVDVPALSNGQRAILTLTVPADAPSGDFTYVKVVASQPGQSLQKWTWWPVVVQVP